MKQANIEKIAIVRLSALGDIVNGAVVLQFIHQHYPNAQVDWICEEVFAPTLKGAKYLHATHTVNLKQLKKNKSFSHLRETIKKLRSLEKYQLIIDMQGLLKSAIVARVLGKNTHGFDKNSTREPLASLFYKTTSTIPYEANVITRNTFVVADALGFVVDDAMLQNKEAVFAHTHHFELPKDKKNILFVIGASWESKIYPKEQLLEVIQQLQQHATILWGNQKEKEDALWLTRNTQHATLAPQLSLDKLPSYVSSFDLVIGNDTGPTHLAWTQNIPSITLFGPTNERMIYQTPHNLAIHSPSKVNLKKIDKKDFSIKEIPPQTIVKTAKELLSLWA